MWHNPNSIPPYRESFPWNPRQLSLGGNREKGDQEGRWSNRRFVSRFECSPSDRSIERESPIDERGWSIDRLIDGPDLRDHQSREQAKTNIKLTFPDRFPWISAIEEKKRKIVGFTFDFANFLFFRRKKLATAQHRCVWHIADDQIRAPKSFPCKGNGDICTFEMRRPRSVIGVMIVWCTSSEETWVSDSWSSSVTPFNDA